MIHKFLHSINFFKELLKSYTGYIYEMFVPKDEKFFTTLLIKSPIKIFSRHFGSNGHCILADNSPECPVSKTR